MAAVGIIILCALVSIGALVEHIRSHHRWKKDYQQWQKRGKRLWGIKVYGKDVR